MTCQLLAGLETVLSSRSGDRRKKGSGTRGLSGRRVPASSGAPRRRISGSERSSQKAAPRKRTTKRKPRQVPKRRPARPSLAAQLSRRLFSAFLGALLGVSVVGYILYCQAEEDVQHLLAQPVWEKSGRVYSAPLELWPGMHLTAGDVAADLQAAGYARVRALDSEGDFRVTSNAIVVRDERGDHTIAFRDGVIASTDPGAMIRHQLCRGGPWQEQR